MCDKFQSALDLVAKRWTGQIVHALQDGPLRFGELSAQIEVVGDQMLAERLRELEEHDIVSRNVLQKPLGVEYALTEKGRSLTKVFGAVEKWAEAWFTESPRKARAR
jgi:DNA-binding HxlR family transcriptional regulator